MRELCIVEFSHLSFEGLLYMGAGPIPLTVVYFIVRKEWQKKNLPSNQNNENFTKVLMLTWDNRFDWKTFWVIIAGAVIQILIYVSVILGLKASRLSGLNIGIIEAFWSISPFFVAFTEWILNRVGLKLYQFLGMLGLVVMAILISLADLFTKKAEDIEIIGNLETKLPVYKALLLSLIFPIAVVMIV